MSALGRRDESRLLQVDRLHSRRVYHRTVTDATYTVRPIDRVLGVNRGGTVTVTIPSEEVVEGRYFTVKDESGAAGSNAITIATEGSETIDGASTDTIGTSWLAVTYYSDGTNWFTI